MKTKYSLSQTGSGIFFGLMMMGFLLGAYPPATHADGVTFSEVAPDVGIVYARTPSVRNGQYGPLYLGEDPGPGFSGFCKGLLEGLFGPIFTGPLFPLPATVCAPQKGRGAPGVCIFDYDSDGDEDIYVTNGPGSANSLFSNQLTETGEMSFVEVAGDAGVAATDQDSSGCVAGDLDNDGDKDLYVLGNGDGNTNILYENSGDGSFVDATTAETAGDGQNSMSATLADVDNDGLLDIFVGNNFDQRDGLPIFVVPTDFNQHNQLLLNQGGLNFADVSDTSGIKDLAGMLLLPRDGAGNPVGDPFPIPGQPAGISWAVASADIDLDGDIDLMSGDDQAAIPPIGAGPSPVPGVPDANRGLIHSWLNDGNGNFTDVPAAGPGSWMGISYCDFDHDGTMDFFGSNVGDVNISFALAPDPVPAGFQTSRWFFGNGDGTFTDPAVLGVGVPGVGTTPFGWGVSSVDYDNDGDCDVIYVGNLNAGPFMMVDNPIALLENDGTGGFLRDDEAFLSGAADTLAQQLRVKHGMATGDLNNDGFPDIVSVSNFNIPAFTLGTVPPLTFPNPFDFGGPWDADALISGVFAPAAPGLFAFVPVFLGYPDGNLSIELNSADNGNNWIAVDTFGSIGIADAGSVNRDGIGAVVSVTPDGGNTALKPVTAGSSYASQHSEILNFGLGASDDATVNILWPGGVRNRLHGVNAGESLLFPEIPCSIDTPDNIIVYKKCVNKALQQLKKAGVISSQQRLRFLSSAILAFAEEHS